MKGSRAEEHGVSYVELCLILPFALFCVLAAIEFPHAILQSQQLSAFSREVADFAFRGCAGRTYGSLEGVSEEERAAQRAEIETCLAEIVEKATAQERNGIK